jgi:ATP-dependent Clp protease ATP-binding subunit ClpA
MMMQMIRCSRNLADAVRRVGNGGLSFSYHSRRSVSVAVGRNQGNAILVSQSVSQNNCTSRKIARSSPYDRPALTFAVRSFVSPPPPRPPPGGFNIFNQQANKPAAVGETLAAYTTDLTALAASSHGMDPIIGRHEEIRRCLQILSRRTKNCPVLIGAAGVGKTAIAEGR